MLSNLQFSSIAVGQLLLAFFVKAAGPREGVTFWEGNNYEGLKQYCSDTRDERIVVDLEWPSCPGQFCNPHPLADLATCVKLGVKVFVNGNLPSMTPRKIKYQLAEKRIPGVPFTGVYVQDSIASSRVLVEAILQSEIKPSPWIVAVVDALAEEDLIEGVSEVDYNFLDSGYWPEEEIKDIEKRGLPTYARRSKDEYNENAGIKALRWFGIKFEFRGSRVGPLGLKELGPNKGK